MMRSRTLLRLILPLVLVATLAGAAGVLYESHQVTESIPTNGPATVGALGFVDVEQGVSGLAPLQLGRIEEIVVREGDVVAAGAVLLRLEADQARARVEETRAAVEVARAGLNEARQRQRRHQPRLDQQQATVEAAASRLAAGRRLLERQGGLKQSGLLSREELDAAAEQIKELEATERSQRLLLEDLRLQDPAIEFQRSERMQAVAAARLKQTEQDLAECELKAPQAGVVLRLLAARGDLVGGQTRQPVVLFCPDTPRLVRAEIEQEFASRLVPGLPALVSDDAGSDVRWRGRVLRVAGWYGPRRAILQEPGPVNDLRTRECLIELEPGQVVPQIGQRVRVRIELR